MRTIVGASIVVALILALAIPMIEGDQVRRVPERPSVHGAVLYAAPDGKPSNSGDMSSPLDLASALSRDRVKPGTTVYLRGGTYLGPFTSDLTGSSDAPITVRSTENAVITTNVGRSNGGTLNVMGAWTIYRDFEVTNSNLDRGHGNDFRLMGLNIQAPHTKFINLVVHDTGHGFGFWNEAVDSELTGNIIFNCGTENTATDMRHGHAIYTQNTDGEKLIRDNVMFDQFGWGISGYPGPGGVIGFRIEGNVSFNNGLATNPRRHYNNLMVSGHTRYKTDKVVMVNNYTYYPSNQEAAGKFTDANLCLGCSDPDMNGEATVAGNYLVGGTPVILANGWERLNIARNTIIGQGSLISFALPAHSKPHAYTIDENQYFAVGGSTGFSVNGSQQSLAEWSASNGWDTHSNLNHKPSGVAIFVRPNEYEPGRAHIVIYNWDRRPEVEVDIAAAMKPGTRFEIRNVQDLVGEPVAEGTYDGRPVRLSMQPAQVTLPEGAENRLASSIGALATGPEFNVFLLRSTEPLKAGGPPRLPLVSGYRSAAGGMASAVPPAYAPFVGTYASPSGTARAEVMVEGSNLVLRILTENGSPEYRLTQVSGPRFKLEGAPYGFFLDFLVERRRVAGFTLVRGRLPKVELDKQ